MTKRLLFKVACCILMILAIAGYTGVFYINAASNNKESITKEGDLLYNSNQIQVTYKGLKDKKVSFEIKNNRSGTVRYGVYGCAVNSCMIKSKVYGLSDILAGKKVNESYSIYDAEDYGIKTYETIDVAIEFYDVDNGYKTLDTCVIHIRLNNSKESFVPKIKGKEFLNNDIITASFVAESKDINDMGVLYFNKTDKVVYATLFNVSIDDTMIPTTSGFMDVPILIPNCYGYSKIESKYSLWSSTMDYIEESKLTKPQKIDACVYVEARQSWEDLLKTDELRIYPVSKTQAVKTPDKPSITVTAKDNSATVTISKTQNAMGYNIYMKAPQKDKYEKIVTLNNDGSSNLSYTINNLNDGKYSFRVKAYNKGTKKTVWSSYSNTVKIKIVSPNIKNPFYSVNVGDIVIFGAFEQDNDTSNGAEPIEWIVLAKDEKKVFLLSKYCLDYRQFFGKGSFSDWTWECSSIRKWLNKTFYKKAFTTEEKSLILKTKLENKESPKYHCDGIDTIDRIFLLTCEDVVNKEYRLAENGYDKCNGTSYAYRKKKNTMSNIKNGTNKGYGYWWTRTPDDSVACYYAVSSSNYIYNRDGDDGAMVRPAMYVSLK